MQSLYKFNRQILDDTAKRFFFVADPIKRKLKSDKKSITFPVLPGSSQNRRVSVTPTLYIQKKDKGIKLKGLEPNGKAQWVSIKNVKVDLLMPTGKVVSGIAEEGVNKLKVGDVIQFERVGFCRLDAIKRCKLIFAFGHS